MAVHIDDRWKAGDFGKIGDGRGKDVKRAKAVSQVLVPDVADNVHQRMDVLRVLLWPVLLGPTREYETHGKRSQRATGVAAHHVPPSQLVCRARAA